MPMRGSPLFVSSALILMLAGCALAVGARVSAQPNTSTFVNAWEPMRLEMMRRWRVDDVDSTTTHLTRVPSQAVPGLEYVWGVYSFPERTWVTRHATIVRRADGKFAQVTDVASWQAATDGWVPQSDEAVRVACFEVAGLLSESLFPRAEPVVVKDSTDHKSAEILGRESAAFQRVGLPEQLNVGDGRARRWRFWVLEFGASSKFECIWDGRRFTLDRIDSILGVGLPPRRH